MPFEGAFSPLHWMIIAFVAFLVLGPEHLPRVARQAGQLLNELRRVRANLTNELRDAVAEFDLHDEEEA